MNVSKTLQHMTPSGAPSTFEAIATIGASTIETMHNNQSI